MFYEQHLLRILWSKGDLLFMSNVAETVIELIKSKRGWTDEDILKFTSPVIEDLHDPFLLENVTPFIEDLHNYQYKTVTIVPDYDADGILSGSLLAGALSVMGFTDVNVYTPRIQTGYGITMKSAKEALNRFPGTELIVTTDNGSNAFAGIAYAKEQGVAVLISDHHKAGETDPSEIAVNPNRPSDQYPFKGLSGTGVIWKIMQAYVKTYGDERQARLIDHLVVLVGISTISDVMPLVDENRYIVQKAVERLQDSAFLRFGAECDGHYGAIFRGLFALHTICDQNKKFDYGFDEMTLGFVFGPMLNSPRRMSGSSKIGFALFLSDTYQESVESATVLFGTNEERKTLMKHYSKQYFQPILPSPDKTNFMISAVPFRHGLIGLVAGQFTNQFDLPSIVFNGQGLGGVHFDGMIDPDKIPVLSGSGRSPEWFNLHAALSSMQEQYPDMFKSFGGHEQAAGVAIYTPYYMLFKTVFGGLVEDALVAVKEAQQGAAEGLVEDQTVWLSWSDGFGDVSLPNYSDTQALVDVVDFIDTLKPFGQGFRQPAFGLKFDTNSVDVNFMGADKQHVKFTCPNGLVLIQWNGAEALRKRLGHLNGPFQFAVKGALSVNEFRERKTIQLIVDQLVVL